MLDLNLSGTETKEYIVNSGILIIFSGHPREGDTGDEEG